MGSSEIGYVLGGVRSISCRSLLEYFSSFLTAVHAPTVCSDLVSLIRLRCIIKRERSMAAAKVRSVFTISFKVASVFSPLRTISLLPIRHSVITANGRCKRPSLECKQFLSDKQRKPQSLIRAANRVSICVTGCATTGNTFAGTATDRPL